MLTFPFLHTGVSTFVETPETSFCCKINMPILITYVLTGQLGIVIAGNVICDDPDEHKLLFCCHVSEVWGRVAGAQ